MTEFLTPITTVAKGLGDWGAADIGYIWNCKSKFKKLERKLERLKDRQGYMERMVNRARNDGDVIDELVVTWLDRVETEIRVVTGVMELKAELKGLKNLLLHKRYHHGKKAVKKAKDISRLLEQENFDPISYPSNLQGTCQSSEPYEELESRTSILKQIMEALNRTEVTMVGIHGMGGVGKTTLARKVGEEANKNNLFDYVVFAEVSHRPDDEKVREIQGLIAGSLGLKLENDDPLAVRAVKLRERLKNGNKILLILDDLWESLEWDKIGIPFKSDNKGCKILFTARDVDVLRRMDCRTNFSIATLDDEETWKLFKNIAGPPVEDPSLGTLPSDVAKRCFGLPVAIVITAQALKDKDESQWSDALVLLQQCSASSQMETVLSCLRLSYNHLTSELKSIFLLCCTMTMIGRVSFDHLLRYYFSLSSFERLDTLENQRSLLRTSIEKLRASSLLLEPSENRIFSIHDLVLECGIKIAKEQHCVIVNSTLHPRQISGMENLTMIFLVDMGELPKKLDCPTLKLFHLKTKTSFSINPPFKREVTRFSIPSNYFNRIPKLEVVYLEGINLLELPESLVSLEKLGALHLTNCNLEDLSMIGHLEHLEILVISDYQPLKMILPESIGKLKCLRLLDLRRRSFIIPPTIISELTQLEELYMEDWYDERQVEPSAASLEVLKDLGELTTLHMCVADAEALPNGLVFRRTLQRYNLLIGVKQGIQDRHWKYRFRETSKTLVLVSDTNICSEDGLIKQLKDIEDLVLDGKQAINNILCQLDGDGFPKLRDLSIANNPNIHAMPTTSSGDAFPSLETLHLRNLISLQKICCGEVGIESFCQLRSIQVSGCHKLKNLLPLSTAKNLSLLEEIVVEDCLNIEEIFIADGSENGDIDNQVLFEQLHTLTLKNLPRLETICSGTETASTSTCNPSSSEIISEEQLDSLPLFGQKVIFPNLKDLNLEQCNYLKHVFSSSTCSSFKHLQFLGIQNCEALEEFVKIDDQSNNCVEFASLRSLEIWNSPGLRTFLFNDKVSCPNLSEIELCDVKNLKWIWHLKTIPNDEYMAKLSQVFINGCTSLQNIFPASLAGNLFHLERLSIIDCGLKEIVAGGAAIALCFPELSYLSLRSLNQLTCFCPTQHTIDFPKLKELTVVGCKKIDFPKLKELTVVGCKKAVDLFNFQKQEVDDPATKEAQAFSHLENIKLDASQLRFICSTSVSDFKNHFPRLKCLVVNNPGSDVPPHCVLEKFHFLEGLQLVNCSNREIFASTVMEKPDCAVALFKKVSPSSSFKNLKILKVSSCSRMKSLMIASTANSFMVLEEMSIEHCEKVTHIIKEEENVKFQITLSRLKSLKLKSLNKLISFYGGECTFNFPLLEKLILEECPNLMLFSSGAFNMPKLQQLEHNETASYVENKMIYKCKDCELNRLIGENKISFLLNKSSLSWHQLKWVQKLFGERIKDFSNLERLILNENEIEMSQNQLSELVFFELKCICLSNDYSTTFPSKILKRFNHSKKLQGLELHNCSYEEVERRDYKLDLLENLGSLDVRFCNNLKGVLLPSKLSFRNLKTIKIFSGGRLVSLMVASMARSLEQLEELQISWCRKMRQVVTDEEDGAKEKKISFPNLKRLEFSYLDSLTSFFDGKCDLEFPVLDTLSIVDCPRMDIFTLGNLSTPMLRKVSQDKEHYYSCKNNKVDEIIREHHEAKIFSRRSLAFKTIKSRLQSKEVFSNLEELSFRGDEMLLFQSQLPRQQEFPNLQCLEVFEDQSTPPFPLSIFDRFHTLNALELYSCSYEEIFSSEDVDKYSVPFARIKLLSVCAFENLKQLWDHGSILHCNIEELNVESCGSLVTLMPSSSSFQNLTWLTVDHCDGLVNLFKPTIAKSLIQLGTVKIKNCKRMEEVLSSEEGAVRDDEIIFHRLWYLELHNLSSLTTFCSQSYTLTFPSLTRFILKRCPRMKVFSHGILDTPVLLEVEHEGTPLDCSNNLNTIVQEIHNKQNVGNSSQDSGGPSTLSSSAV